VIKPLQALDRLRLEVFPRLRDDLHWTRSSYAMMSGFMLIIGLIVVVWWPLVVEYTASYDPNTPFWQQFDWLLLGIFTVMSLLIMAGANLKADAWIVMVGLAGGLAIESWGTQTHIWTYFTLERPPLWIIPAWPTASLAIDRLVRIINHVTPPLRPQFVRRVYWVIFIAFFVLMVIFTRHTVDKPFTWLAILAVVLLILSPGNQRIAVLTFVAGAGLGYFLEVWGTTRQCWTYYTGETPPVFAVLAHGLAAVAFWRGGSLVRGAIISSNFKRKELRL
jgi:hypothetical protein